MVKVEINKGPEKQDQNVKNMSSSPRGPLFPAMEDLIRKCNLVPFGDVTVPNHPASPPVPMTLAMTYLFPVSKDPVTGEARYKMLIPRNGPELAMGFPPMIPFPSPPLLAHMMPLGPGFREQEPVKKQQREKQKQERPLKVEVSQDSSSPLDLTQRLPGSSSEEQEEGGSSPRNEASNIVSPPDQKLGPEIEAQLNFLKVKQMEFLKQAAEASVNRCNECNINFSKYQNFVAHKKFYCSGQKQGQTQDSDDESSKSKSSPPHSPPSSSPFPTSQAAANKTFPRNFFPSSKNLVETPGKLPPGLLQTPGSLPPPQPSSHFVCQGCGIKFKSISNLQAHQSRYCAGIKTAEEGAVPGQATIESLIKMGLGQHPQNGISAANMMTFLSAQQALKQEAATPEGEHSPRVAENEVAEDFCCILCGFKESSVDKLKDHINMHFIGQVKKRKSGNGEVGPEETKEKVKEPAVKRIKVETKGAEEQEEGSGHSVDPLAGAESSPQSLSCDNCDISFVNPATYSAHVQLYCKK